LSKGCTQLTNLVLEGCDKITAGCDRKYYLLIK